MSLIGIVWYFCTHENNTEIKNPHFPSNLLQLHVFPKLDKTKEMPFNFSQIAKKNLRKSRRGHFLMQQQSS